MKQVARPPGSFSDPLTASAPSRLQLCILLRLDCRCPPLQLRVRSVHRRQRKSTAVHSIVDSKSSALEMTDSKVVRQSNSATSPFMQDRMDFLREDLKNLFSDVGVDQTQYDAVVQFRDPITSYNDVKGYLFNIKLLKRIFSPNYLMHDIRQTGEYEITTRWTMEMPLAVNKYSPFREYWDPKLVFTGTSIMGVNRQNGKFNRHIDTWDAIDNQEYFSWEAARHVLGQMFSFQKTPDLPTPACVVLKKTKQFEVRRYQPFVVAETPMSGPPLGKRRADGKDDAGSGAFNRLARYIFGGNERQEKMQMTTPVFSDSRGRMRFVVSTNAKEATELPAPEVDTVVLRREEGGLYAANMFSGVADEARAGEEYVKLLAALCAAGIRPARSDDWVLARYNDPSTWPRLRRNEVLVALQDFELW